MSGPDGIDERFGTLVGELRSGEVTASPELRERVRAIATRGPEPPAARLRAGLSRRRLVLVLAPVCALVALAVGFGVLASSGSKPSIRAGELSRAPSTKPHPPASLSRPHLPSATAPAPTALRAAGKSAYSQDVPAPSGSRHQLYSADVRLRVSDLSGTTKEAIRLTRAWGGYVVTVDYGSGQRAGEAYLVVRVPIAKVQTALAKLTSLGTIVADHVSIQDIQGRLNQRFAQMADLRAQIEKLQAKLTDTSLPQSQRDFFQAAIAVRQAKLAVVQDAQTAQKTRASFATVSLDLETKKAAAVAPSEPSRIGEAMHNIGRVLVTELEVLLYVLLIGAPFAVLAVLLWLSVRSLRRRSNDQLLAR